jgi:hypothetical protein
MLTYRIKNRVAAVLGQHVEFNEILSVMSGVS